MANKIDWDLYDNTEESGQGIAPLKKGIYVCKVLDFEDVEDKQYLKIKFDIAQGEFKDYFKKANDAFKEWKNNGYFYRSYKPSAYSFLKNFVTALEKSNDGYNFKKTQGDFREFVGKLFVGVFGEEEIPYADDQGNPIVTVKLQSVRSIEAMKEGKITIPELKKLSDEDLDKFSDNNADVFKNSKEEVKKEIETDDKEEFYESSKKLASEKDLPF